MSHQESSVTIEPISKPYSDKLVQLSLRLGTSALTSYLDSDLRVLSPENVILRFV